MADGKKGSCWRISQVGVSWVGHPRICIEISGRCDNSVQMVTVSFEINERGEK